MVLVLLGRCLLQSWPILYSSGWTIFFLQCVTNKLYIHPPFWWKNLKHFSCLCECPSLVFLITMKRFSVSIITGCFPVSLLHVITQELSWIFLILGGPLFPIFENEWFVCRQVDRHQSLSNEIAIYIFHWIHISWWRHQMVIFSALLVLWEANSPVTQRPVTRSFDVFFDLCLNKRLRKPSGRRWFQMPSCSLWRHCDVPYMCHCR